MKTLIFTGMFALASMAHADDCNVHLKFTAVPNAVKYAVYSSEYIDDMPRIYYVRKTDVTVKLITPGYLTITAIDAWGRESVNAPRIFIRACK